MEPLILEDILHRGVSISFQAMSFQKRGDCCHASPTIDLIGRMFISHVLILLEIGDDGIIHDGE